jgi:hypothetical protein
MEASLVPPVNPLGGGQLEFFERVPAFPPAEEFGLAEPLTVSARALSGIDRISSVPVGLGNRFEPGTHRLDERSPVRADRDLPHFVIAAFMPARHPGRETTRQKGLHALAFLAWSQPRTL